MNCLRSSFIVSAVLGLTACASQSVEDHYYSLVLAADNSRAAASAVRPVARLIVGPIHLARYLDQPGLALQIDGSEIRVASHHLWAEPLDVAIGKVLVGDLSRQLDNVAVDRDAGRWTTQDGCRLRLEFDKFHATDDSRLVVTGRYWLYDAAQSQVMARDFNIVQTLSASGYPQAVRQLRTALETLAADSAGLFSETGSCHQDPRDT